MATYPRPKKTPLIHPGEMLREEFLEPLGLTQKALAEATGMPASRIGQIIAGKRSVTADTAMRLGRYFRTSAAMWMNLQQSYDLELERRRSEKIINREVKPMKKGAA